MERVNEPMVLSQCPLLYNFLKLFSLPYFVLIYRSELIVFYVFVSAGKNNNYN